MKIKKQLSIALAVVVSIGGWAHASVIDKPVAMQDAMVSITVSDLHGFIDGIGGVAAQVSPMASGMMIKNMAGMQLGDPGLAGIAPGKGLAIVMLDQTSLFAILEVSEAQAPAYSAVLTQQGMQSKYVEGALVIGGSAAEIEKGVSQLAAVKQTLLTKRSASLNIVAQPAALIEKNKEQIDGMMQMLPMMMGMGMAQTPGMDPAAIQSIGKILEGELRVILSLAGQCDIVELVLAPKAGSLQIDKVLASKAGTRLATLLNAPKVTTPNPKVQSGLLGDAAIALDCTLSNPEALTAFFCEELELVLKDMGIEVESITKMKESMMKWAKLYKGSFSENIGFGGESFMNVAYILDVGDEAEAVAMLKSMEQDLAGFMDIYKSLGMPMTLHFKENVRQHNGANIHQFKVNMTLPQAQMAEASGMDMDLTNMVYDVAICDGLMLYAMGDTKVEALIDRVKDADFTPAPLKARSVYPAGGIYYCDVDVARYLEGLSSMMPADPNNPLPQVAAMLKGADPIVSAGFRESGMVMWSINVPGSLLAKVGQAAMAAQVQRQMSTSQQNPQQPVQTFEPAGTPDAMPAGLETVPTP